MHDPPTNLYRRCAVNPELMKHLGKSLLAQNFFSNTGGTNRCQAVDSHTAHEPHRVVRKNMIGIAVNWVTVEEAPVFGSEMSSSAVIEKNGTPERPDLLEPVG